ncbi:hypothetical protein Ancab_026528 [Ancistrocladus abbreviatus]
MESTNFQEQQQQPHLHQPQDHYVAYPPPLPPLPNHCAGYGVSATIPHEWNPATPSSRSDYNEVVSGVSDARCFARQSISSLLHMAKIREGGHIPSPFNDFGGINQDPSNNDESSWLINSGLSSPGAQHGSPREYSTSSLPQNYGGLCHFPSSNPASLNQLPLTCSSSAASSSFPLREYFLSSCTTSKFSGDARCPPLEHRLPSLGKQEYTGWGPGDVQQSSNGSPSNSCSKTSASMNGVTGSKRHGNYADKLSKASSHGGGLKKSSLKTSCPPIKVRKEKLGDRIAALHQLVSPFGKTDTASVLTEAIGYIQFLQEQIHTLCMPHVKPLRNTPFSRTIRMSPSEDDVLMEDAKQDLRRRGLCIVPLSWTSFITTTDHQLDPSHHHYFLNSNS